MIHRVRMARKRRAIWRERAKKAIRALIAKLRAIANRKEPIA